MGIDRKDMRAERLRQQLSLRAMALKVERVSETLLWRLEEYPGEITHPRIALRVAKAYNIDDPYSLMHADWRGREIPPPPEPSKDLLVSIRGLGREHKNGYTSYYAKDKEAKIKPVYSNEDKEIVDMNGPAIAMLMMMRELATSDVSRKIMNRNPDWLRNRLQSSRKMHYGDAKALAKALGAPVNTIIAGCPEREMRKIFPDSFFEASEETKELLCRLSPNSNRKVNKHEVKQWLEEKGLTAFADMCRWSKLHGLPLMFLYNCSNAEGDHHVSFADAKVIVRETGIPPEKLYLREEDARVFTCASGTLSAPATGRTARSRSAAK